MRPDDEEAFREFVASRMPALRKLAFVTCGDWHAAEDAVANALAKLYPRWGRLERPELYAQTMVFRAAIDETRRPWWRRERSAGDRIPEVAQADPAAATDERLRVRSALLAVPKGQRAVLVLRFYLGMTAEDAADVLGVRAATVRSQTARGLANLRAALAAGGVVVDDTAEHGGRADAGAGDGGSGGVRVATTALHR
ncbi:sigma-70 family RNA polymerase sigma factor [Plantactinospora sp. WMMB334]|uniref:sigma-70 family RNA polymerase sigma factor n=1 Tax=Plantactinospora sp. WMMB334 TaxID=3404119 RepID=UPI003B9625E6